DSKTGIELLKILSRQMFNHDLGVFQDVINSSDGIPLNVLNSTETSALFLHAVDNGIFGIKPDMSRDEITISPKLVECWGEYERFGKLIGEHRLHIKVNRRHENFVDIVFNFEKRPDMKLNIALPDNIEMMEINKVKYEGNKAVIRPGKNNRLWGYYRKKN
ncbi:MAG: hypothetical protein U9P44_03050, partial [archaeon]|nr:hypothetical protein [archaeon]